MNFEKSEDEDKDEKGQDSPEDVQIIPDAGDESLEDWSADVPISFVVEDEGDLLESDEESELNLSHEDEEVSMVSGSNVPPQYRGMPSEIVEELWVNKVYLEDERNKQESERRRLAIDEIKENELVREGERSDNFRNSYSELSESQRGEYLNNQKEIGDLVVQYIQGKKTIDELSPSEALVLDKIRGTYKEFKKENPDSPFSFGFTRDIDRMVYNNLFYRLSFEMLEKSENGDDLESVENQEILENMEDGKDDRKISEGAEALTQDDVFESKDVLSKRYEDIANKLPIDEKRIPSKDMLLLMAGGNSFAADDEPSLAGKVIMKEIYDKLVSRLDYESILTSEEIIQIGKDSLVDFKEYINELNSEGNDFKFNVNRPSGTTGFHLNGESGRVTRDHLFYFNKSMTEWKNPQEQQVRAYITIKPEERKNIQRHFVDICKKMYNEGIDFSSKAVSPNGLENRTDDMVLYISLSDQAKAGEIIKEFLEERVIGQGHVISALPSLEDGLSWALEPSEEDVDLWQKVSGSSEGASHSSVVATKISPIFLRRIAIMHQKFGNQEEADAFNSEAERVERIMKG
ncbi:MAG: T3SS effector HopA1 family protein [Candidatus Pacebacteria bacterium]|nr:T3SS effector HopA1 family protein [Candidatus Paceibacterota bacterium]